MNEKATQDSNTQSDLRKKIIILAGGMSEEEDFRAKVEELMKERATEVWDIHKNTSRDLMNLLIQPYEERNVLSTQIDDAFRVMFKYSHLKKIPENFPLKREQVNELIYEMLISAQSNLPDGMTVEDVSNIWAWSIENFYEMLQERGIKKEKFEDIMDDAISFWRQFARTLQEKRKIQKPE